MIIPKDKITIIDNKEYILLSRLKDITNKKFIMCLVGECGRLFDCPSPCEIVNVDIVENTVKYIVLDQEQPIIFTSNMSSFYMPTDNML